MEPRIFAYTHSSDIECLSPGRYRIQIYRHHMEANKEVVVPHAFVEGETELEVWQNARREALALCKTIPKPKPSWE